MKKSKAVKIDRNKTLIVIAVFLLLAVFGVSIYNICIWNMDSYQLQQEIEDILKNTRIEEKDDSLSTIIPNPPTDKENPYWEYIKTKLVNVDLESLKQINPDTRGWIQVAGTNINYPFVQSHDNYYYLNHSFYRKNNGAGWVFLDSRNNIDSLDWNTIIYAHGRIDSILFSTLKNILKSNWYENEENHIIKMSTDNHDSLWQIFSVYHVKTTSDYLAVNQDSPENNINFLNYLKGRSAVQFQTELYPEDKILTLSTCFNSEEKVVMHAKLIKIDNN